MTGLQFLSLIFVLALSYFSFVSLKRQEFTIREYIGWQAIWLVFALTTLFPDEYSVVAGNFGAIRPLDFFTIIGFIVVLSISFYTYVNVDRLRKQLEKTIRDLALRDLDGK